MVVLNDDCTDSHSPSQRRSEADQETKCSGRQLFVVCKWRRSEQRPRVIASMDSFCPDFEAGTLYSVGDVVVLLLLLLLLIFVIPSNVLTMREGLQEGAKSM